MTSQSGRSSNTIVITGLGAVTPVGTGVEAFWKSLSQGKHGFGPLTLFNPEKHRTQVAAEVDALPDFEPKRLDKKLLSRSDIMQLAAVKEALLQAKLFAEETGSCVSPAMGVINATAAGGILGLEEFFRNRFHRKPCDPAPLLTSFCLSATATNVAKEFILSGPRATTATVCSSSGLSLAMALELLRMGEVKQLLVIASESLCEVTHAGFNSLRAIAPDLCRPFDKNRKGLILGEGAGAIVLETLESAVTRQADILASIEGYGLMTDLHHFTAPDPEGRAIGDTIQTALADAGIDAGKVDYINAHGTGTPLNDAAECQGIKKVFGADSNTISVSSSKSMIGHTLGAASLLEGIATIKALRENIVPPTANYSEPDPECDLDITPNKAREKNISVALSNSFAFGGSNVSVVFKKSPSGTPAKACRAENRVLPVITGIGLVTPYGVGKDIFRESINAQKNGLSSLAGFGEEWSSFHGGLVNISAVCEKISPKRRRHLNRLGSFLTVSTNDALEDAGLADADPADYAMSYGSAFGCSSNVHNFYTQLLSKSPTIASPQEFMLSVTNAPAALVAQHLKIKGPLWVFVADEASWDITLHWSARLIANNISKKIIVSAADEISESILAIHQGLGFMNRNTRDNLVLGEGSISIILEPEQSARERGANIYAALAGWSTTQDHTCGPMDFSSSAGLMNRASAQCLENSPDKIQSLFVSGPENSWPALDELSEQSCEYLQRKPFETVHEKLRPLFGESGATSGFALAAALLSRKEKCSHAMVQTSSRGGIQAATLVKIGTPEH